MDYAPFNPISLSWAGSASENMLIKRLSYMAFGRRCGSSYKVFSDLLRKQYTKQQNNGP